MGDLYNKEGIKIGRKVPKKEDEIINDLVDKLKKKNFVDKSLIDILTKENEMLQRENISLQNKILKLENKKIKKVKFNGKINLEKWLKYYNSKISEAVDFNGNNIDTNKSVNYIKLMSAAKELLKKIFESFNNDPGNRIDTINKFKSIMFNPLWYQDKVYRQELVETLKKLDITNDNFVNSELVMHYFN